MPKPAAFDKPRRAAAATPKTPASPPPPPPSRGRRRNPLAGASGAGSGANPTRHLARRRRQRTGGPSASKRQGSSTAPSSTSLHCANAPAPANISTGGDLTVASRLHGGLQDARPHHGWVRNPWRARRVDYVPATKEEARSATRTKRASTITEPRGTNVDCRPRSARYRSPHPTGLVSWRMTSTKRVVLAGAARFRVATPRSGGVGVYIVTRETYSL